MFKSISNTPDIVYYSVITGEDYTKMIDLL